MSDTREKLFLTQIHIKGFKSIEDVEVDIKKGLNILIGKNGSGKSNFLEGILEVFKKRVRDRPHFSLARFKYSSEKNIKLEISFQKNVNYLKSTEKNNLDNVDDDQPILIQKLFIEEQIVYDNSSSQYIQLDEFRGQKINNTARVSLNGAISRFNFIITNPLLITFYLPSNLEFIEFPGTLNFQFGELVHTLSVPNTLNFISKIIDEFDFLGVFKLYQLKKPTFKSIHNGLIIKPKIIENLKRFTQIEDVRFNENINVYRHDKGITVDNIKIDFKVNGNWQPWSQLSDGTKRLFYLITEITDHENLVLVEEPELGVHPHQFNLIMDFLKEQAEDKQIIISTHSPQALNHLSPDELDNLLITRYDAKKGTQIEHLTDEQKEKAKAYMQEVGFLSDYWTLSDLE